MPAAGCFDVVLGFWVFGCGFKCDYHLSALHAVVGSADGASDCDIFRRGINQHNDRQHNHEFDGSKRGTAECVYAYRESGGVAFHQSSGAVSCSDHFV